MNDVPPPPPLRLKPRAQPAEAKEIAPPPLVEPVDTEAGGGARKLRIKPRLAADTVAVGNPVDAPPPDRVTAPPERAPAAPGIPPIPTIPVEVSIAVTPPPPEVPVVPVLFAPSEPPPAPKANQPAPFPLVAKPRLRAAKPIHIHAADDSPEEEHVEEDETLRPEGRPAFKIGVWMTFGLMVVIVVGGIFAAKKFLPADQPLLNALSGKATVMNKSAPATSPASTGSTPSETLNGLAHIPFKAISKAKEVVDASRKTEKWMVDELSTPEELAAAAKDAKLSTVANTKTAAKPTSLAPGVTATTAAVIASSADTSPAFRSFVANARIGGVFQGNPPRALINGKLRRAGEVVDIANGIIFERIDADKKEISFKDQSGAIAARKY